MLLLVAAVGGLFVLGRSSRPAPEVEAPPAEARKNGAARRAEKAKEEGAALLSEGFDYEQQVEGKPVFRLKGDRFTTDKEGKVSIQKAHIEIFRQGEPFRIESREADFDPETHDAQLRGDVHLEGGGGWSVDASRLDVVSGGKVVVSKGERVKIRRGEGLRGGADRISYAMDDERLRLAGNVRLGGREEPDSPRVSVAGDELIWDRDGRSIEASGGIELGWGESRVRAAALTATVDASQNGFEQATLAGKVEGVVRQPGERRLSFGAQRAEVAFEADGKSPASVRLSSEAASQPVEVRLRAEQESPRNLRAPLVTVLFKGGQPELARAEGGVLLEERVARGQTRKLTAQTLDGRFDAGGDLESAQAETEVVLTEKDLRASGDRATLSAGGAVVALEGAPARARSARGELLAPRLDYTSETGLVHATGGVRASLRPESSPIARDPAGKKDDPVQIESAQGEFNEVTQSFAFAGGVQAIQGTSLLFADRLSGSDATGKSRASGSVKTIWRNQGEAGTANGGTTTTTAGTLDYDRTSGEIHYAESVKVRQSPRELTADDVVVILDSAQQAKRLKATGQVTIADRSTGRTVEGADADYDLVAKSALVTGQPVTIRETNGTMLRGRRALYDFATGGAKLLSEQP